MDRIRTRRGEVPPNEKKKKKGTVLLQEFEDEKNY